MKKLLALTVMALPAAMAVPASGQFGASAKVALLMLEGKTAPCKNPALNTAVFQTACATVPLNAAAFKANWPLVEQVSFPGLTLVQDWKADPDPASKGAFSRAYALNETPFLVYYQPTGNTGHLTLIYRSDLQPTAPAPASNASSPKFSSCAAARAAGYSNMRRGQPGYSSNLDQDNDGVACDQ